MQERKPLLGQLAGLIVRAGKCVADRPAAPLAPDQAPAAHRGHRSEPAFVAHVIAGLAAARGEPAADTAALTTANARRIFATW
jgi:hypothetical protein